MNSPTTDLRIFLSSTFTDMQEEREYLMKKVFPEIRRICRERGVVFTEVDLRWGITERQARRHKIVELCLDEITRHKPYIITLIGDRYGWRPDERDLKGITDAEDRYPWLPDAIQQQRSLTELESLVTPLNEPDLRDQVFFYFKRKSGQRKAGSSEEIENEREALQQFRERVLASNFPCREGYRTPKQLGEWVREDLLSILDSITPERGGHDSWLEAERRGHNAFAESRRRAYIEHEPTLRKLDEYVATATAKRKKKENSRVHPIVVTGESGSGKSSLLSWWSKRFCEANPNTFVIEHYIGATPGSSDQFGLLRRVMVEIKERYGIEETPPLEPADIVNEFPAWLARIGEDHLVILIDALNQLAGTDHLDWLPLDFHPNVRIILSTLPGPLLNACTARKWPTIDVHLLGTRARQQAVRAYFNRFGKQLEPKQTARIAANSNTTNPLYLRTSLEELRIFGQHEKLDDRINHYLAAESLEELYQRILERMEVDFGKGLTRQVMSLIWASRNGLSLEELQGIIEKPTPQLSKLLAAFDFHMIRQEGLYRFHHDYLRGAVERRYLKSGKGKRSTHRTVAEWFSTQPPTLRRAMEELSGWSAASAMEELSSALTNIDLFSLLNTEENRFTLLGFWRTAKEGGSLPSGSDLQKVLVPRNLRGKERALHLSEVAQFLRVAGEYSTAAKFAAQATTITEKLPNEKRTLAQLFGLLGTSLTEAGNYREAEKALKRSVELTAKASGKNSLDYAQSLEEFGSFCYQIKEFKEAEKVLKRALKLREHLQGKGHRDTASTMGMLGAVYYGQIRYEEAEECFRYELEVLKRNAVTTMDIGVATCMNNMATLLTQAEKYEEAITTFRQVLKIYEGIYGENHPDTGSILTNLSLPLQRLGLIDEAELVLRKAIHANETALGLAHPQIAIIYDNLGTLLLESNPIEAESCYRKALNITTNVFESGHIRWIQAWLNIASVIRFDPKRQEEALQLYETYLPYKKQLLGKNNPSYIHSHSIYKTLKATQEIQHIE
ncbi:MAG: tetratricopeptide repeat protein [Candidatus Kapaibacterium sp.]